MAKANSGDSQIPMSKRLIVSDTLFWLLVLDDDLPIGTKRNTSPNIKVDVINARFHDSGISARG